MKALLIHPGTQYSHRLAFQLNRINFLYKFITGIAFTSDSIFVKLLPDIFKAKISNRILDESIFKDKLLTIRLPELQALYQLSRKYEMENVLHERNKTFQRRIPAKFLKQADAVIGFDTSSWIIAEQSEKLNKPFILDQSIAHPNEKRDVFSRLRDAYPQWIDDIPEKSNASIVEEVKEQQLATKIVVASTFTKNSLVKNGIPESKIFLNPYGVGKEFFQKKGIRSKKSKTRFIYLGSLGSRKGLPFLLDVWMKNNLYHVAELWLAGPSGKYAQDHVAQIPGIFYKGNVPFKEIPLLLAECDCLVFPSFFEGFGQVILEAMAAGLPVITTEATAGPDIIEDGVDGFLIKTDNSSQLANAMEQMADDPSRCFLMGVKAQEKATAFSWEAYGERWKDIIKLL